MKFTLFLCLAICLSCTNRHLLTYSLAPNVEVALANGMNTLDAFYKQSQPGNYFGVVSNDIETRIILCKREKISPSLQSLLQKSNRSFTIRGRSIPFFYFFDTQSDAFRKKESGYFQFGGYGVVFDYSSKIIFEGMLF